MVLDVRCRSGARAPRPWRAGATRRNAQTGLPAASLCISVPKNLRQMRKLPQVAPVCAFELAPAHGSRAPGAAHQAPGAAHPEAQGQTPGRLGGRGVGLRPGDDRARSGHDRPVIQHQDWHRLLTAQALDLGAVA